MYCWRYPRRGRQRCHGAICRQPRTRGHAVRRNPARWFHPPENRRAGAAGSRAAAGVNREDRISGNRYQPPPYLIVGGLVFTELSVNYLSALGSDWRKSVGPQTLYELLFRSQLNEAAARSKPIVLSKVLKHPSNIDFGVGSRDLLTQVNGRDIHSMRDLATALAQPAGDYHHFHFLSGREEALDRAAAAAADTELLQHYNIPSPHRLELPHD